MLFFHWHFNMKFLWPTEIKQDKGNHTWERKRAISFLSKSCHFAVLNPDRSEGKCEPLHYIQATSSPFLLKSTVPEMGLLVEALIMASFLVGTTNGINRAVGSSSQPSVGSHCSFLPTFSLLHHSCLLSQVESPPPALLIYPFSRAFRAGTLPLFFHGSNLRRPTASWESRSKILTDSLERAILWKSANKLSKNH